MPGPAGFVVPVICPRRLIAGPDRPLHAAPRRSECPTRPGATPTRLGMRQAARSGWQKPDFRMMATVSGMVYRHLIEFPFNEI